MRQSTRRPLGVAITRVLATALIVVGGFFAFAPSSSSATVLPSAATSCPEGQEDSELGCIPIFNPSVTVQASVDCSGKLTGSVTASAGSAEANTFYRNVMIRVVLKDGTKLVDNLFSLPANQAFTALGVSPDDTVTATADFASEFITDFDPVVVSSDVTDCPTTTTTTPPTTTPPATTVPPTTAPPTTVKPPTTTVPVTTAPPTTVKPPVTTVPPTTAPSTTTTTSPPPTSPPTTPPSRTLPATGAGTTRQQSGLALVLVIAGVVMLLVSRKRARL